MKERKKRTGGTEARRGLEKDKDGLKRNVAKEMEEGKSQ